MLSIRPVPASVEQLVTEEAVCTADSRQGEEEATAHRKDVFLQRFALEPILHGEETLLQATLVGDERQPLVETPRAVESPRVVESAPQDSVFVRFGRARIGEPDVGVELYPLAIGILGEVGIIELLRHAKRRTADLAAADDSLLLGELRAVPELDEHSDD